LLRAVAQIKHNRIAGSEIQTYAAQYIAMNIYLTEVPPTSQILKYSLGVLVYSV